MTDEQKAALANILAANSRFDRACRIWTSQTNDKGYGRFRFRGTQHRAHRVAYELMHGPIPKGMSVCHRCDTPGCVNAFHLFLGTNADNTADMVAKGRQARGPALAKAFKESPNWQPVTPKYGEANGLAKLTVEKVAAIKRASGTLVELAAQFGVSRAQIGRIRRGEHWKEVQP